MQYSDWEPLTNSEIFLKICFTAVPQSLFVMREEVAELVKSFEQVNEILDGFRYKMGAYSVNSMPFGREDLFDCLNRHCTNRKKRRKWISFQTL